VQLTTRSLAEMNANPRTGRSEAFRIAMRELMAKGSSFDAHPSQWAPFVVIGEGAVPQVAK
jgi:CHAT domain-containing protein